MDNLQPPEVTVVTTKTPKPPSVARQRAASANGKLGAGRKTPAGLAASSQNATKHGLTAKSFNLLAAEHPEAFALVQYRQMLTFKPRDYHEFLLVKKLINARWAIERADHMQIAALNDKFEMLRRDAPTNANIELLYFKALDTLTGPNNAFAVLQRYLAHHHRLARQAQADLIAYRKLNPSNPPNRPHFDWESFVTTPDELSLSPDDIADETELPNEAKLRSHFVSAPYPDSPKVARVGASPTPGEESPYTIESEQIHILGGLWPCSDSMPTSL